jgi:recombination protein RecA
MAAMQRKGGTVALIDAEHAFDPVYAASLGLNARDMILTQPDSGEMALEVVDRLVRSSSVDVIAVDSVAALVPQAEIEGEIGLVQVGSQARLMSQALRKLAANASRGQCTIIFLNQLRSKIGVIYGSPEVTSGGNALKFYASVRMDIRKIAQIPDKAAEAQTGIRCKVKVVKNKVAPPYRQAEFDIMFGSGISHLGCVVDAAEATGVLVRKGSWYSYKETNLGQGREKTMAALAEDSALAAEIEAAVRASGAFPPSAVSRVRPRLTAPRCARNRDAGAGCGRRDPSLRPRGQRGGGAGGRRACRALKTWRDGCCLARYRCKCVLCATHTCRVLRRTAAGCQALLYAFPSLSFTK